MTVDVQSPALFARPPSAASSHSENRGPSPVRASSPERRTSRPTLHIDLPHRSPKVDPACKTQGARGRQTVPMMRQIKSHQALSSIPSRGMSSERVNSPNLGPAGSSVQGISELIQKYNERQSQLKEEFDVALHKHLLKLKAEEDMVAANRSPGSPNVSPAISRRNSNMGLVSPALNSSSSTRQPWMSPIGGRASSDTPKTAPQPKSQHKSQYKSLWAGGAGFICVIFFCFAIITDWCPGKYLHRGGNASLQHLKPPQWGTGGPKIESAPKTGTRVVSGEETKQLLQNAKKSGVSWFDTVFPILANPREMENKANHAVYDAGSSESSHAFGREQEIGHEATAKLDATIAENNNDEQSLGDVMLSVILSEVELQGLEDSLKSKKLSLNSLTRVVDDEHRWNQMVGTPLQLSYSLSARLRFAVFLYRHQAFSSQQEFQLHWRRLQGRGWTTVDSFENATRQADQFQEFLNEFAPGEIIEYEYLAQRLRRSSRPAHHAAYHISV